MLRNALDRRRFFHGALVAGAVLVLPACQASRPLSLEEAVRRLLYVSSENAFARLTEPGGFWDRQVATVGLGELLGVRGDALGRVLTSPLVRDRLRENFSDFAINATERAAPVVADAVREIGYRNAFDLVNGDPRGATAYLRGAMAERLIDVMVPALADAMDVASDPLLGQLLNAAAGVDVGAIARTFAGRIDDIIWNAIGDEEAAIRADPGRTRDPVLIGVFGAANRL